MHCKSWDHLEALFLHFWYLIYLLSELVSTSPMSFSFTWPCVRVKVCVRAFSSMRVLVNRLTIKVCTTPHLGDHHLGSSAWLGLMEEECEDVTWHLGPCSLLRQIKPVSFSFTRTIPNPALSPHPHMHTESVTHTLLPTVTSVCVHWVSNPTFPDNQSPETIHLSSLTRDYDWTGFPCWGAKGWYSEMARYRKIKVRMWKLSNVLRKEKKTC